MHNFCHNKVAISVTLLAIHSSQKLVSMGGTPKLRRIMKLTALLLTAFCLQVSARTGAQVTYSGKDVRLDVVFQAISKQTGYIFLYTPADIKNTKPVTIDVRNVTIDVIMKRCLEGQLLEFSIEDKTVFVKKAKHKTKGLPENINDNSPIEIIVRVTNEEGEPVAGVTVQVKGEKIAAATNGEGVCKIKADANAVLVLTGVNIESIEENINGRKNLDLQVKGKTGKLDEVQIIAYGSTSQRFNTGNISSVKSSEIGKQIVSNPLQALQGRVPGLFINQNNGLPGGSISINIQGITSLGNGTKPFYVIDGVPYSSEFLSTVGQSFGYLLGDDAGSGGGGNPLSYINPADIERIDILKDADATAIYGSRAANGAILITTKKGKAGKTKFDITVQKGWGSVSRKLRLLNTAEYLVMRKEGKKNDNATISPTDYDINGFWDTTRNTDWIKELIGNTAHYLNLNSTVSGGTRSTQYLLSGTYQNQTSVFPGNYDDKRAVLHFKLTTSSSDEKLKISFGSSFISDNNLLPGSDLTSVALTLSPTAPTLYNDDKSINWQQTASGVSTWSNPVVHLLRPYENNTTNLIANGSLSYSIVEGLAFKASFGINKLETNEYKSSPRTAVAPENISNFARSATYSNSESKSWIIEPQINYNMIISNLKVDMMLGATWQEGENEGVSFVGSGYIDDALLRDIRSAVTVRVDNSEYYKYKYNALFGRLNLLYDRKYIATLSARRDGSSRFGPENRLENFWSIGGGWIFTEEVFFKNNLKFLTLGKIKASYGTTGNDQIGNYKFLSLFQSNQAGIPYQNIGSVIPLSHSNKFLQWELTKKFMGGLDLSIFKERLTVSINYVDNRSSNQLTFYTLPLYTGFGSVAQNFPALIQNKEWQFTLNTINIKKGKFNWESDLNFTIPKNTLLDFPEIATSSYSNTLIVGKPVSITRLYSYAGVDAITGRYQILNSKGEITSTPSPSDRTQIVSTLPKWYGGISNSLSFKKWEFSFFIQVTNRMLSNFYGGTLSPGRYGVNQPVAVLNRWQKVNDVAPIQYFSAASIMTTSYRNMRLSTRAYSNATYARLKNAYLAYNIPDKWKRKFGINSGKIYATGQNLLTITRYDGLDPETGTSALPPLKLFALGFQLSL